MFSSSRVKVIQRCSYIKKELFQPDLKALILRELLPGVDICWCWPFLPLHSTVRQGACLGDWGQLCICLQCYPNHYIGKPRDHAAHDTHTHNHTGQCINKIIQRHMQTHMCKHTPTHIEMYSLVPSCSCLLSASRCLALRSRPEKTRDETS